ncbi:MAG TPA: riboflavin synthase [Usitatibacter sp.]|nr:riboflavin synthase [Usitatibacter sp.]
MFSGIVAAVGRIASEKPHGDGVRIRIQSGGLALGDVKVGDSIAVQGVCLTVVALDAKGFEADVSRATLDVTHGLAKDRDVNLENSLRMGDRLDGHLVSGHVDGVGSVVGMEDLGGSTRVVIEAPSSLERYIAVKGSITVDGVSLTVNSVAGGRFEVNLIPHTLSATTLRSLRAGSRVNMEVDLLARYVARLLQK